MRAGAERGEHAGLTVLPPLGGVALDVEALGLGKALRQMVRHGGRHDDRLSGRDRVVGEIERVRHGARDGRCDRIHPQRLERDPVRDIEMPHGLRGQRPVREARIRLGGHPVEQVGVLQQRIEHERARAPHRVEPGDERPQHRRHQIGLGQELRVDVVERHQVVHEVGLGAGPAIRVVDRLHRRVKFLDPLAGAPEARGPHQHGRPLARDARREERAHEDDHVVQVVAGRHAGGDGAELLGDDALQGVQAGNGLVEGPLGNLAPRDGDDVVQVLMDERARVARLLRLAHPGVLGPVHAHHRARRAQLLVEFHPELARPEVPAALASDEQVGLGSRKHREPAVEGADAEDWTEPQVLPGEERSDVASHRECIPDQGQTRRAGRRMR